MFMSELTLSVISELPTEESELERFISRSEGRIEGCNHCQIFLSALRTRLFRGLPVGHGWR